jgi:hypothetical protein
VDDPDAPQHAQLTPLGARVALAEATPDSVPELVPEESRFFVQPNADVFAPPNLSPRSLFHLRRLTGEKKGGPAGMFPLTMESLRRALDAGLTRDDVLRFLEAFSRTGLPPAVRSLVETVGRQHGRIRLVPAGYVLVADDPALMRELRGVRQVEPLLGAELAERVAAVSAEQVSELMKRLRARGYAPLNAAETGLAPPLGTDPDAPPPVIQAPVTTARAAAARLDWSTAEEEEPAPQPGPRVTGRRQIRELLEEAWENYQVVEIEYDGRSRSTATVRSICPLYVDDAMVEAYCRLRGDERNFNIGRINWARLTGETFEVGLDFV